MFLSWAVLFILLHLRNRRPVPAIAPLPVADDGGEGPGRGASWQSPALMGARSGHPGHMVKLNDCGNEFPLLLS